MARAVPADRFESLIAAGTATFIEHGYRRTQMQDVADALGVAKGTVYAVVSSKEALLLACVRYADGLEVVPEVSTWPLPSPSGGDLVALVADRLGEVSQLALHGLPSTPAGGASTEIELIITDLMSRLARHRRAIKLVDRCAPEVPELAELWFGAGRAQLVVQLADHLSDRALHGHLRTTFTPVQWEVVARTVVESCVLWAVHLHWDPAPEAFRTTQPVDEVDDILSRLFANGLVEPAKTQE
jgi:AcrR family transcriptional regulator